METSYSMMGMGKDVRHSEEKGCLCLPSTQYHSSCHAYLEGKAPPEL